ncbi:hypothetical protein H072_373 [Dactylellina haptotyla CBS 200.50]|uniref:Uncharacterized protein n=1 Tax=Dactylellina haptotyla (strain CBS 200.50) TaxID=1284197 RepID=S8AXC2_DACHA|nr:hypothetical protein H072_373 [Dactylellina haptotyla CBS 200.50]
MPPLTSTNNDDDCVSSDDTSSVSELHHISELLGAERDSDGSDSEYSDGTYVPSSNNNSSVGSESGSDDSDSDDALSPAIRQHEAAYIRQSSVNIMNIVVRAEMVASRARRIPPGLGNQEAASGPSKDKTMSMSDGEMSSEPEQDTLIGEENNSFQQDEPTLVSIDQETPKTSQSSSFASSPVIRARPETPDRPDSPFSIGSTASDESQIFDIASNRAGSPETLCSWAPYAHPTFGRINLNNVPWIGVTSSVFRRELNHTIR